MNNRLSLIFDKKPKLKKFPIEVGNQYFDSSAMHNGIFEITKLASSNSIQFKWLSGTYAIPSYENDSAGYGFFKWKGIIRIK